MKIELDREKKIKLLQWLKQGYIETNDIEEMSDRKIVVEVIDRTDQVRRDTNQ
jgi:hypothetical protein